MEESENPENGPTPKNEDSPVLPAKSCALCGCSTPAVRCDRCSSQTFCLSCDDMYHRHPKRRLHLRKAVESIWNSARSPRLRRRTDLPGDPSKIPIPPPRSRRKERHTIGGRVFLKPGHELGSFGHSKVFDTKNITVPPKDSFLKSKLSPTSTEETYENEAAFSGNHVANIQKNEEIYENDNVNINQEESPKMSGVDHNPWNSSISPIQVSIPSSTPEMIENGQHFGFPPKSHSRSITDLAGGAVSPGGHHAYHFPHPYPYMHPAVHPPYSHSMAHLNCAQCLSSSWSNLMSPHPSPYFHPMQWGPPSNASLGRGGPPAAQSHLKHSHGDLGAYPVSDSNLHFPYHGGVFYPPGVSIPDTNLMKDLGQQSAGTAKVKRSPSSSRSSRHAQSTEDLRNTLDVQSPEASTSKSPEASSNGLVNKVKQEKMEEEPPVPVAPKAPWSCLHCTFINPPGIYICQVCCKTSYGNKSLTDSEENLNNARMVDSRNSESPMELVNMDAEIMSSEYTKHKAQKADDGICQDSLETSLENEEAFKEVCGRKEVKDADFTVMLTTETQTSTTTKSTDAQTQNIICNTMASSTDSIFPKQEMSIQTELEELPKLCSVATDPMISSHSMESLMSGVSAPPYHNRRAGWGRGASFSTQSLYERGRSRSPLPRSASLYNEAYSFARDSSLPPEEVLQGWNQSWLMTDPMYYKPHNLPEHEQTLPKGDYFDGTWGSMDRLNRRVKSRQAKKQESLHRPKLHRSLDDLKSDKTQHDFVHSQELVFLQTVKEAERCGFSLEDLHVAYLHCGRENPVFWLEDNWSSMVKNVIALAAKYGEDNEENDVGVISASEAKDALHIHRGDIWDAVTECIENRQRKILELTVRGNFTQKQISEALTKNEGNVELAYADLFRASNKRHKFILSPGLSEDSEDLNILIQTEEGMDNATTSVKLGRSNISADSKTDKKKSDFLTKLTAIRQAQSERRKAREEKEMVRETITSDFPLESSTLTEHETEMAPSPEAISVMEEQKSQSPVAHVDLEKRMPQYPETETISEERKELKILSKDEPEIKPIDNIILTDDKKDHDDNIPVDYDSNWIDSQGEWIEEYSDEQWEDEGSEQWVSLQEKFHNMEKELAEEATEMAALWEKEELEDDVFEEDPETVIETHVSESDQRKTEQDEKFQQWVKVNLENNFSEEEEQTNELKLDVKTQAEILSKSVEFDDTAICSSPLQHYPTEFDLSSKSLIEPDWVEVQTDALDESKIEESNKDVSNADGNQYEFMERQSPSEQDLKNQELNELENSDIEWEKIDFEDIQKIKYEEEHVLSDRDIKEFNFATDEKKLEFTNTLEEESLNMESNSYLNEPITSNSPENIIKEMNNISKSEPTAETHELKDQEQKLSQELEEFTDIQKPRPPVRRKSKLNASAIEEALKNHSKNQDVVSDTEDVPPALPVKVKDKNLEQSSIQDVYAIPVKVKKNAVEESSSLLENKSTENYDEQKELRFDKEKEMSPPVAPLKPPRLNIPSSPIENQKTSPSEIETSGKNASRLGFSKDASPVTSLSNESDSNCFADSESDPEIKIVRQKMHRKTSRHENEEMDFQDVDVMQDTELPTALSINLEKKQNKHHILMQELDFDPELPIPIGTRGCAADDLSSPKAFREGSARPLQLFKASKSDTSPIVSPVEAKSDTFISTSEKRLEIAINDQKQRTDSPSQPIISPVSSTSHTLGNEYERQEMNDYYNTTQKDNIVLSMKHKATDGQENYTLSQLPNQNVAVPVNNMEYYNVVEQKEEMKPEILNDNVKLQSEGMSSNIEQIEESQLPNISDNIKSNASDEIIEDPTFTGMEASSAAADYFFGRYNEVTITRPKKKTIIKVDRSGMPLMPKVMSSSEIKIPPPSKPLLSPMEQSASPVLSTKSESKEKTSQPSLSAKISDSSVTLNTSLSPIEQKQEPVPTETLSFAEDYFFGSYNDIVPPKKPKKSATISKLPQLSLNRIQEVPDFSTALQTATVTAVTTSTFTVNSGSLESVASMPLSVSDDSQFESMIDADTISTTSEVYYMAEDVIQDQNVSKAYNSLQESSFDDKRDMKQRTVHFEEFQPPVIPPPRKNRSNSFSKSSVAPRSISMTNQSFEFHSTRDLDSGVLDKKKLPSCSEDFKIIQGHDPSIFPSDVPSLSNMLPNNLLSSEISIHASDNLQNVPGHILKHEKCFEMEADQGFIYDPDFSDAQSISMSNLVCENILSQDEVQLNNESLEKVSCKFKENSPSNEVSSHFNENSSAELKETDIENLISDFRSISEDLQDLNEILFPLAPNENNNLQETLKGVHLEQDSSMLENEENYSTTIAEEGLKVVEETQNVINSLCDLYFAQSYDISTSNEAETFDVKNNNRDLTYDSENEWKMNEERNNSLNASFIENPLYNSSSEISSLDAAKDTELIINDVTLTSDSLPEFQPVLIDTKTDTKSELNKSELDLENHNVTIEMLDQDHQTEIKHFDSLEIKSSSEILSMENVEEVSNGNVPDFAVSRLTSNIFSDIESGTKLNEPPNLTETHIWENAKFYEVQPLSVICQAVSENLGTRASTSSDLFPLPFFKDSDKEFDVDESILKKTEENNEKNLVKETDENYPLTSTYSAAVSIPEHNLESYLCEKLEVEEVFNKIYSDLVTVDEPILDSPENVCDERLSLKADDKICDKKDFYLSDYQTSNEDLRKENCDISNLEAFQEAIIEESGKTTNNVLLQSNSNTSFPASSDLLKEDLVSTVEEDLIETAHNSNLADSKINECDEITCPENSEEPDFTLMSHFYEEWFEDIKPSDSSEVRKDLLTMYATYYSSDSSAEGSENASENEDFVQVTKDSFVSSSTNSEILMRSNNSLEVLETLPTSSCLINEMEEKIVITPSQIFSENVSTQNEIEASFSSEKQTDQLFPQEIKENLPFTIHEVINPTEYKEIIKNELLEASSSRNTNNFEISTDIGNQNSNECSSSLEMYSEQKTYRSSKSCQTDDSFEEDQFFDSFDDTFTIPSFVDFPFDKSLNKEPIKAEIGIQCSLISDDINLMTNIPANQFTIIQNKTLQMQESNEFEDLTEEDSEMISAASSVQSEYLTEALDEAIEESNSESIEESDSDFFLELHSSYDDDNKISQYFSRYADIDSDTGFSSGSEIGSYGTLKGKHTNSEEKTSAAKSSSLNIDQIPEESNLQLNKGISDTTKYESYFPTISSSVLDSNTLEMNVEIQGAEDVINKGYFSKETVQNALSCESSIEVTSIKETEGQVVNNIYGLSGESIPGNEIFVNLTTNQVHESVKTCSVNLDSRQSSTEKITSVIEDKGQIEMDDYSASTKLQTSAKREVTVLPLEELVERIDPSTSTQEIPFLCNEKRTSPTIEDKDKKVVDEYFTSNELQTSIMGEEITLVCEELSERVVTPISPQKLTLSCTEKIMTSATEDKGQIKIDEYSTSTDLQTSAMGEETTLSSQELVAGIDTPERRLTSITENKGEIKIEEYSTSTELQTFVIDEATTSTSEELVEKIVTPVSIQKVPFSCAEKITSVIEDKGQLGTNEYFISTELQTSFKEETIALTSEDLIERVITPISIEKEPFSTAEKIMPSISEGKGLIKVDEYSTSTEIQTSAFCEDATFASEELVERAITPISIEKIPFSEYDLKFVPVEELNNDEINCDDAVEKESTPTVEYFYGPLPLSVEIECMQERRDSFHDAIELLNECITEAQKNILENEQELKTPSFSSSGEGSIKDDDSFSDAYCSLRNDDDYNSDSVSEYFVLPEVEFTDTLTTDANEPKLTENIQDVLVSKSGFDFVSCSEETQNNNVIDYNSQSEIISDHFSNAKINRTIGENISLLETIKNKQYVNQINISSTESSLSSTSVCNKTENENAESNEILQIITKEKSDNAEITEPTLSTEFDSCDSFIRHENVKLCKESYEVEQLEIPSKSLGNLFPEKQTNVDTNSNDLGKISDFDEIAYTDNSLNIIPLEINLNKRPLEKELDEVNETEDIKESECGQSQPIEDTSNNINTKTLKSLCENLLVKSDENISLLPELLINSNLSRNVAKESELKEPSSLGDSNKMKISGDIPLVPSDVVRYLYYDDSITFEGDSFIEDDTDCLKSSPLEEVHDSLENQKKAFNDSVVVANSSKLSSTYASDSKSQYMDGKIESKENVLDLVSPIIELSEMEQLECEEIYRNISKESVPLAKFEHSESVYSQSETTDQWFETDTSDSQQQHFESIHSSYPKISSTSAGNDLPCVPLSDIHQEGINQVYVSKDFRPDSDEMTDISTHFTMTDDSDKFSDIESDNSLDNFDEKFYYDVENPEYNESVVLRLENSSKDEKDTKIINEKTELKVKDDQFHPSLVDQYSRSKLIEENRLVIDVNGNVTNCETNKNLSFVSTEVISSSTCDQFSKVNIKESVNANKFSSVENTAHLSEMLLSNENQSELHVIDNSELSLLENSEYCLASDSASSESDEFFPPAVNTSIKESGEFNKDSIIESKINFVDRLITAETETSDTLVYNIKKCDLVSTIPAESDFIENGNFEQNIEGVESVVSHEVETDPNFAFLSKGDISTVNKDQIVKDEMSSIVKQKDVTEAEVKEKSVDALEHLEQLPAMSDGIQPESISILNSQKEMSLTLVSNDNLRVTAESINVVDLRAKQSTELDSGYAPPLTVDSNLHRTEGLKDLLFNEEDNIIVDFKGNLNLGESIKTDSAESETSLASNDKCLVEFSESVTPFIEQLDDNSLASGFHDLKLHQESVMGLIESKEVAGLTDEVSSSKADSYLEENTEFSLIPSLKSDESITPISPGYTKFSLEKEDVANFKIDSKEKEMDFIKENNILLLENGEKHHEPKQLEDGNNSICNLNSEEENYHSISDTFPLENSFNTCNGTESTSFYSISENFDDTLNMMSDDDFTDVPSHATLTEDTDVWSDVESDVFFEADHFEIKNFVLDRESTPTAEKTDGLMSDFLSEDNIVTEYKRQTVDLCDSNQNKTNIEASELLSVSTEIETTNLFSISEQVPAEKIVKLDQSEITEHSTNYNAYQFSINETISYESAEQYTENQKIIEVEENQRDERTTVSSSDTEYFSDVQQDDVQHPEELVGKFEMPISSSNIFPIISASSDSTASIDSSHKVHFENLSTEFATEEVCKLSDSQTTLEIALDNIKLAEIDHETDSSKNILSEANGNSLIAISQDLTDVASFKSFNDECEELSDSEATNPPEDILLTSNSEKKIDFIPDNEIMSSLQEIKSNVIAYEIENVEISENTAVEDLENKCLENLSNISEEITAPSNTASNQNDNKLDSKQSSNVYETTSHDSIGGVCKFLPVSKSADDQGDLNLPKEKHFNIVNQNTIEDSSRMFAIGEDTSKIASSKLSIIEDKEIVEKKDNEVGNKKFVILTTDENLNTALETETDLILPDISETASYNSISDECEKLSDSESTNPMEDFLYVPKNEQFDIINQDASQDFSSKLVTEEQISESASSKLSVFEDKNVNILTEDTVENVKCTVPVSEDKLEMVLESESNVMFHDISETASYDSITDECEKLSDSESANVSEDFLHSPEKKQFDIINQDALQDTLRKLVIEDQIFKSVPPELSIIEDHSIDILNKNKVKSEKPVILTTDEKLETALESETNETLPDISEITYDSIADECEKLSDSDSTNFLDDSLNSFKEDMFDVVSSNIQDTFKTANIEADFSESSSFKFSVIDEQNAKSLNEKEKSAVITFEEIQETSKVVSGNGRTSNSDIDDTKENYLKAEKAESILSSVAATSNNLNAIDNSLAISDEVFTDVASSCSLTNECKTQSGIEITSQFDNFVATTDKKEVQYKEHQAKEISSGEAIADQNILCSNETSDKLSLDIHFADTTFKSDMHLKNDATVHLFIEHFAEIKSLGEHLQVAESFAIFDEDMAISKIHEEIGEASLRVEKTEESDYWLEADTEYSISEFEDEAIPLSSKGKSDPVCAPVLHLLNISEDNKNVYKTASQLSGDNATDISVSSFFTDPGHSGQISDTCADMSLQEGTTENSDKWSDIEGEGLSDEGLCDLEQAMEIDKHSLAIKENKTNVGKDAEKSVSPIQINATDSDNMENLIARSELTLKEKQVEKESKSDISLISKKSKETSSKELEVNISDSGAILTKVISDRSTTILQEKSPLSSEFSASSLTISGLSDDEFTSVTPLDTAEEESDKFSDISESSVNEIEGINKSAAIKEAAESSASDKREVVLQSVDGNIKEVPLNLDGISRNSIMESPKNSTRILTEKESDLLKADLITSEKIQEATYLEKSGEDLSSEIIKPSFTNKEDSHLSRYKHIPALDEMIEKSGVDTVKDKVLEQFDIAGNEKEILLEVKKFETQNLDEDDEALSENFLETIPEDGYECNENLDEDEYLEEADDFHENFEDNELDEDGYPTLNTPYIINEDEFVYPLQYPDWIEESFDLKEYGIDAVLSGSESDIHGYGIQEEFDDIERNIDLNVSNFDEALGNLIEEGDLVTESFKTLSNGTSSHLKPSDKEHDSWSTADAISIEDDDYPDHDDVLSKIDELLAEDFKDFDDEYKENKDAEEILQTSLDTSEAFIKDNVSENRSKKFAKKTSESNSFSGDHSNSCDFISEIPSSDEIKLQDLSAELNSKTPLSSTVDDMQGTEVLSLKNALKGQLSFEIEESQTTAEIIQPPSISDEKQSKLADKSSVIDNQIETLKSPKENNSALNSEEHQNDLAVHQSEKRNSVNETGSSAVTLKDFDLLESKSKSIIEVKETEAVQDKVCETTLNIVENYLEILPSKESVSSRLEDTTVPDIPYKQRNKTDIIKAVESETVTTSSNTAKREKKITSTMEDGDTVESKLGANIPTEKDNGKVASSVKNSVTDEAPALPRKKRRERPSLEIKSISSSSESLTSNESLSLKEEGSCEAAFQTSSNIPEVPTRRRRSVQSPSPRSRRRRSSNDSTSSSTSKSSIHSSDSSAPDVSKKRLSIDERVMKLQNEGKCSNKETAFIAAKLIEMQFEEEDALLASKQCSSVYHAIKFLTQLCELCNCRFPINLMVSLVHCTHRACKECLKAHFTSLIYDRSVFHLLCPICHMPDITDQNIQEYFNHLDMMLRNVLESGVYDLFQRKLRDEVLTKDPNFHWCSQCSSGFIASPRMKKLYCPDCSAITCASCHQTWELEHEGVHCERFQQWKDMHTPEPPPAGLVKYLTERGITCPSCGLLYAQACGGCLMYKCGHCSFEFCGFCVQPFKRGKDCSFKSCISRGMHAHHPLNCLFYIRDKEISEIQMLLEEESVTYLTIPPKDQIVKSRCQVREQKNVHGLIAEDRCGRDIVPYCAGLCKTHYYEYLAELLKKNKISPLPIMTTQDLQFMLRKSRIHVPEKVKGETNDEYYQRLTEVVTSNLV